MADNPFTVKIDGRTFAIDPDGMTLGDHRLLKVHFGLDLGDVLTEVKTTEGYTIQTLNFEDPNVLVALLSIAVHQEQPTRDFSSIVTEIEALGIDGFDISAPEVEAPVDPPKDGPADEETKSPAKAKTGKSAKTRKNSGDQS